jgi:hypothetical protein
MRPFPSPDIHSARLDLREYGTGDAALVHQVLAAGDGNCGAATSGCAPAGS